jgi:hypothetical protein
MGAWNAACLPADPGGDARIGDFDEHNATRRTSGLSSTQSRGRGLALAG